MNAYYFFLLFFLFSIAIAKGQDGNDPPFRTDQLESEAEKRDAEPEDDAYEMELEQFRMHPLNLNTASETDLSRLQLLAYFQIRNFISYRNLLGPLLSVHELQAVPGWDLETIHKIIPYIRVSRDESVYSAVRERWKKGDATFLLRAAQVIEKSRGFEKPSSPGSSYYEGSAQKIFMRYTYNYKQLLLYGISGEKDAGEPFLRGAQRYGFDFYSVHFFLRQSGLIRALALGDFTVNLGQGLIQWQTTSFTKSSQALAVKREADCLKPYHSAGEFNFHRGVGVTIQKGQWQVTGFLSGQKISTSLIPDTATREEAFGSFQNSGYHRTPTEIANRNNSAQFSAGGNLRHSGKNLQIGMNGMYYSFSRPFQKRDEPYNFYSFKGTRLNDESVDYSCTLGNLHLFGEYAVDRGLHPAVVQGALLSLSGNLDMAFVYRNISPAFQSLYSDAFTENNTPNNENGFYTGLTFRPFPGWEMNMYSDIYQFPWLKYRVDAPSHGRDFFFQVSMQPNKVWRVTGQYKNEMKMINDAGMSGSTHALVTPVKQQGRLETQYNIGRNAHFTSRLEMVWITQAGTAVRHGFLGSTGLGFRGLGCSGNVLVTVFDTDDYDTRLYIYEPDLLYGFSLPAYYGGGFHYNFTVHRDLSRLFPGAGQHFRLTAWLHWDQTFYPDRQTVGTGLDEIPGNRKSFFKIQLLISSQ